MPAVRRIQLVGLLLWRGGMLVVAASVFFEAARWVLRWVELPLQLEIGFALVASGAGLVIVSLVWERIEDARAEGNLRE